MLPTTDWKDLGCRSVVSAEKRLIATLNEE